MKSKVERVGIVSPGDMGHAVGQALGEHGLQVIACLEGRSERTRKLAAQAGMREVATFGALVSETDLILSILVPAAAVSSAKVIAEAMRATGNRPDFADCNAVSPRTAREIEQIITDASGRFIDASIVGFPPSAKVIPRLYTSGPHDSVMSVLDGKGIEVMQLGGKNGRASALKMCYAGLTKGTFALYYAVGTAAARMELFSELSSELEYSQPEAFARMQHHLPRLPAKAFRWIGEMEQIAKTFDGAGLPSGFHEAAAEMYRLVSQSPLGRESPETIDEDRTLNETIAVLSAAIHP